MSSSTGSSLESYMSGIKSWAALCDTANITEYFLASEDILVRYAAIFWSAHTFTTCLMHVRWTQRSLRLPNDRDGSVPAQVRRSSISLAVRAALQAEDVQRLISKATEHEDRQ